MNTKSKFSTDEGHEAFFIVAFTIVLKNKEKFKHFDVLRQNFSYFISLLISQSIIFPIIFEKSVF
jgi:hypothetical protein